MKQFAIFDNNGVQFGLPAREFNSREAAELALDGLQQQRDRMEAEATTAYDQLKTTVGWDDETLARRANLQETVARWGREKDRTWSIKQREVTPWTPA